MLESLFKVADLQPANLLRETPTQVLESYFNVMVLNFGRCSSVFTVNFENVQYNNLETSSNFEHASAC